MGLEGVEECRGGGGGGGGGVQGWWGRRGWRCAGVVGMGGGGEGSGEGKNVGEVQPTQWVRNRFLSIEPGLFMGDWLSKKSKREI
jgi:hypothetical protein